MSDDKSLLEQMRKVLGDREDVFADAEKESKQLLQGLRDLDRDPNMRVNNKLIEWLEENGVWVSQKSAWGRAPHPLVIASNTEDDGESCGRGLLARESLTEGELLMTIPLDLCLTRALSQQSFGKAVVPDYMDEYLAIAILLMSEKVKGTASRWKPYIDVLPDAGDVYPSFIWTEAELDMLKGSPTYAASKSLR
jgi:histone-lysine N-methyltransferase SETD3